MRRRSFSTVPDLHFTKTARSENHEHRAVTFWSVLHHMNLHTVHTQEKSGAGTNRQMTLCACLCVAALTLLRALLSSIPSLFFLHCGLARHLPLYFLLIISVYPLGGPREAALESPPVHKAGVFYITSLTGTISASSGRKCFIVSVRPKPDF